MSIELKVKFNTLSEETKIIKREEQKALKYGRKLSKLGKPNDVPYCRFENLHDHRISVVRPTARATHLARGYIRGLDYKQIENYTNRVPTHLIPKIEPMIQKYGLEKHTNVTPEAIREWMFA